jgi:hypothetical protein
MHLLGRQISVDFLFPDGTEQRLVEILDWDFNWQGTYAFAKPVPIPFLSSVRLRAVYDNSEHNHHNPNSPPATVTWGERTVDEMCVAFLWATLSSTGVTVDPPPVVKSIRADRRGRLVVTAKNLGRGGRIEIDGKPVTDSAVFGPNRLRSVGAWEPLVPETGKIAVRVRRADGRLSPPRNFER